MSSKVLSLHGKGLKLHSRADIEPWLKDIDPTVIEEVHLGGNTIGVDASAALAEFLAKTTVLKVSMPQCYTPFQSLIH
jgi:Ran GTPase-activating protein 1